nr:hypothetical protein TetV2_00456 [Oceanusvirus sp.]
MARHQATGTGKGKEYAAAAAAAGTKKRRASASSVAAKKRRDRKVANRGNTFADAGTDTAAVFQNIQNNLIKMVRYRENNSERPDPINMTIHDLWTKFNEGKLIVYGPSQRKCVSNMDWFRQLLKHMINSPTVLDPITLRQEKLNGEDVLAVADGAQRITCFFLFRSRMISAEVLTTKIGDKRSQRNIDRNRKDHGMEVRSVKDLEANYRTQFYDRADTLYRGRFKDEQDDNDYENDGHVLFVPVSKEGIPLSEPPERGHLYWGIDLNEPFIDLDNSPRPVIDFYEEIRRCMLQQDETGTGMLTFDIQDMGVQRLTMDRTLQNNFTSNKLVCNVTRWSRQATSLGNLTASLQKFNFCQDEFPRLVGDYASEWLKTLEFEFINYSKDWGITSEMDCAYGVLVRAFLITQGSTFVPVRQDVAKYSYVINDLMEKYMFEEPDVKAKIRFRTALNNLDLYNFSNQPTIGRSDTKINPDEMVQILAYLYFAIDPERMPEEYVDDIDDYIRENLVSEDDDLYLPMIYSLIKEKGSKERRKQKIRAAVSVLECNDPLDEEIVSSVEEELRTLQTKEGTRNLASAVYCLRTNFVLDNDPMSQQDAEGDGEEAEGDGEEAEGDGEEREEEHAADMDTEDDNPGLRRSTRSRR